MMSESRLNSGVFKIIQKIAKKCIKRTQNCEKVPKTIKKKNCNTALDFDFQKLLSVDMFPPFGNFLVCGVIPVTLLLLI